VKVLIVDDELLAREGLDLMLAEFPDIEIVGQCGDGQEAVESIRKLQPDLVFLDINMPGGSGFDVVQAVGAAAMPLTVFLTAYDEFAVEAFRINALDYLLKPVSSERLADSLARARQVLAQDKTMETRLQGLLAHMTQEPRDDDRVVIRVDGHVYFLKPEDISHIQADGDYVTVFTRDRSHLVRDTMKNMEDKLSSLGFQRIHRSSIVNLDAIGELVCNDNGEYDVILHDDTVLKLSRSYRDALYARMARGSLPG